MPGLSQYTVYFAMFAEEQVGASYEYSGSHQHHACRMKENHYDSEG